MNNVTQVYLLKAFLKDEMKLAAVKGDFLKYKGLKDVLFNTDDELMQCIAFEYNKRKNRR